MLLVPCPWCGPREEIEFRYGGQAGIAYPSDPEALSDEAWADFLFMRDNPKGAFAERWYHVAGCRRWFERGPRHGDVRVRAADPSGRGRPDDRPADGVRVGRRSTAPRPIAFTFDGEEVAAFEGDTIASAILANGIEAPFRSPILGRPRGVFSAGVEEPNAFVEISEPWFDPIVAATMVDARRRAWSSGAVPGVGRLRGERLAGRRASSTGTRTSSCSSSASGHDGFYPARDAADARRPRAARRAAPDDRARRRRRLPGRGRHVPARARPRSACTTTATSRCSSTADELDRLWHVRARRVILATGAFERSDRVRRQRPAGRDAGHAASPYLEHGVLVGSRTVVFTARAAPTAPRRISSRTEARCPRSRTCAGPTPDLGPRRDAEVLRGWVVVRDRAATDGSRRSISTDPTAIERTIECDSLARLGRLGPEPRALARRSAAGCGRRAR